MPARATLPSPALLLESPAFLLAAVGGLLGLNFPLGKLAAAAGVPAVLWAALINGSAAVVLGALALARGTAMPLRARHLRYFAVTAVISYALPNAVLLSAIPHLGSGLTAMFYTLSPALTVVLAALARLSRPARLELFGIAVGFVGALLVASGRGEVGRPAAIGWVIAALLIPMSLACGNVYRSLDWPEDADPLWLAVGSNAAATIVLLSWAAVGGELAAAERLAAVPWAVLAQVLASPVMFVLFFRLQRHGGPVTLSQIGTVAAAVGVAIGAAVLGERYAVIVWAGVAIIAAGLAMTLLSRWRGDAARRSARR
ncbi:MAG: DMT family transporter [Burkholderiales bacterium]|nr:DMT family transporter [Burkholderiales bacterium]